MQSCFSVYEKKYTRGKKWIHLAHLKKLKKIYLFLVHAKKKKKKKNKIKKNYIISIRNCSTFYNKL